MIFLSLCSIFHPLLTQIRGRDFRTEFSELAVIKTLIPGIPFVAVTATCKKSNVKKLSDELCMRPNLKTVYENPNRSNIIAKELLKKQEHYPITVIYMQLQFCGKAYSHFEKVLGEKQYVGGVISPETRLFNQFHSPSTGLMKEGILEEIKSNSSRIRVLFATTALGMGVDARDIVNVIHIGPPSSIESYVQEFGRAGRSKGDSWATLFFNKSDIAANTHLNDDMRAYCTEKDCLRARLMNYFSENISSQSRCCCFCHPENDSNFELAVVKRKSIDSAQVEEFKQRVNSLIKEWLNKIDRTDFDEDEITIDADVVIAHIDNVIEPNDLLDLHISNKQCRFEIYNLLEEYAPKL